VEKIDRLFGTVFNKILIFLKNYFFMFLYCLNVVILKIIFKNKKFYFNIFLNKKYFLKN
jgi:hypothetical protein